MRETMLEFEPKETDPGPENPGAVSMLIDSHKPFEKGSVGSGMELGHALHISRFAAAHAVLVFLRTREKLFLKTVPRHHYRHTPQCCQ